MRFQQQLSFQKPLSPPMLAKILLDPLISVGMLLVLSIYLEEVIDRNIVILSLLVFALTFPGSWSKNAGLFRELKDVLSSWPLMVGSLLFLGYATGYLDMFSHEFVMNWVLLTPVVMLIVRHAVRKLLYRFHSTQLVPRSAVIIGAGDLGCQLRDRMREDAMLGIDFKGFFDDRGLDRSALAKDEHDQLLGMIESLAEYVKANSTDLIYIALPMSSQPRILKLLDDLMDTTSSIYFVPDIFLFDLIQARISDVGEIPVIAVCETPFSGMNGFVKRASDIALSLAILILISPVMLILAIGVKLSSPGPVLFKQRRYGEDGQEILVYKFRSMTVCEDGNTIAQASRNDVRITRLGAILRKTSLDELPQFVNVLRGEMSIVGPRPHAVAHNEMYRKLIKGYMIRHKVKPGITGWAQVNGLRGETETVDKMKSRIEYDLDYLRRWSLKLDILIILRTILLVFNDAKAY